MKKSETLNPNQCPIHKLLNEVSKKVPKWVAAPFRVRFFSIELYAPINIGAATEKNYFFRDLLI